MYSAYKLNKQGDNIQPWHPPFPIWNQSVAPCPVLIVAWPASWETCVQVKEQQLKLDMEQQTGSKLGKEYVKAAYLLPCLFNLCAEYIMRNVRLDEVKAGIKIARRNINNLR